MMVSCNRHVCCFGHCPHKHDSQELDLDLFLSSGVKEERFIFSFAC
jgi:hypothetical protein